MSGIGLLVTARVREDARDRELMERSASGERGALEELYNLYKENVYRSCMRICRNTDDAVDATQEAFTSVLIRIREDCDGIMSFRDYLFTASWNKSLRIIAKRNRAVPTEEMLALIEKGTDVIEARQDPERSLLIDDQRNIVRSAIGRLLKRQLQALTMYELNGMDYAEIGNKMGLHENAVAQLISRARERLRTEVRYVGAAQSSSASRCNRAMVLMPRKVDGTLTKRETTWLDPHIEVCDTCKTNLSLMEEVGTSYRSL